MQCQEINVNAIAQVHFHKIDTIVDLRISEDYYFYSLNLHLQVNMHDNRKQKNFYVRINILTL